MERYEKVQTVRQCFSRVSSSSSPHRLMPPLLLVAHQNEHGGTFQYVYKARDKDTGKLVTLKRYRNEEDIMVDGDPPYLREIAALTRLQHPCVIKLLDTVNDGHRVFVITEFVETDLHRHLRNLNGLLPPDHIKSYTSQIIQGIEHCHRHGIMHRNIQPGSIVLTSDGKVKLSEFDISRTFTISNSTPSSLNGVACCLWYRPPEILLGSTLANVAADMWAIGATVAEMLAKKALIPASSELDALFKIFRMFGTPSEHCWPGVSLLPAWSTEFPKWPTLRMKNLFEPRGYLCEEGMDMIEVCFCVHLVLC